MTMTPGTAATTRGRSPAQLVALVFGLVFLLVGVLGFIPGITTHYSDLSFAGHNSDAQLLGLFMVSVLHNLVHLAFGVAGVALSRSPSSAVAYLVGGGIVYLVVWLYGVLVDQGSQANFVPVDTADNWLHLFLGVVMVGAGLALRPRTTTGATDAGPAI